LGSGFGRGRLGGFNAFAAFVLARGDRGSPRRDGSHVSIRGPDHVVLDWTASLKE
jgi:hypothetical protein